MPSPALRLRERRPGSADRPSLACSGIGAIHRADPAGLVVRHSPRHRGPRLGGILPQKQQHEQLLTHLVCRRQRSSCRSAGMHGFVDQRAVRGAEHRRRCGKGPKGRGDGSPRLRSSTRTYCLRDPATPRSAGDFAAHEARQNAAVGARPFWLLFGAMPKSNPLATGERKLCAWIRTRSKELDSGLRRNDEQKKSRQERDRFRLTPR